MKTLAQPISAGYNLSHGARTSDFNGWQMPTFYSSIMDEYKAVRNHFGIFDVSHMGRWWVQGKDAQEFLNYLTTNDLETLQNHRALYTLLLNEESGIIDDLIIYKFNPTKFLVVNNAGNHNLVSDWFRLHAKNYELSLKDITNDLGQIAVQGPNAKLVLDKLLGIGTIKYFSLCETNYRGENLIITATGYTGEKGYELYASAETLMSIWNDLIDNHQGLACGLGSRDLLRLEAGYCLHGNDIDSQTTPYEAGLEWVCKLSKNNFIGKSNCTKKTKRLVGLRFEHGKKILARAHTPILLNAEKIGEITSGNYSPKLECGIALAYIHLPHNPDFINIQIRDNVFEAVVSEPWFYRNIN
jgi:aminomethyltransferase